MSEKKLTIFNGSDFTKINVLDSQKQGFVNNLIAFNKLQTLGADIILGHFSNAINTEIAEFKALRRLEQISTERTNTIIKLIVDELKLEDFYYGFNIKTKDEFFFIQFLGNSQANKICEEIGANFKVIKPIAEHCIGIAVSSKGHYGLFLNKFDINDDKFKFIFDHFNIENYNQDEIFNASENDIFYLDFDVKIKFYKISRSSSDTLI